MIKKILAALVCCCAFSGAKADDFGGVWWAGASENGWGVVMYSAGPLVVAGWYHYDAAGRATWLLMPGCLSFIDFSQTQNCIGPLYRASGSWLGNYSQAAFTQAKAGTVMFSLVRSPAGSQPGPQSKNPMTMNYVVDGVTDRKTLTRLLNPKPQILIFPPPPSYTGVWWGGSSENGWGVALFEPDNAPLVGIWYTFDTEGRASWLQIAPGRWVSPSLYPTYQADLVRAFGSPLIGVPYDAAMFVPAVVGTITIVFTDDHTATMRYTVDGVTQTKPISKFLF